MLTFFVTYLSFRFSVHLRVKHFSYHLSYKIAKSKLGFYILTAMVPFNSHGQIGTGLAMCGTQTYRGTAYDKIPKLVNY